MRQLLLWTVLTVLIATNVGCLIPAYSGDPAVRTRQLLFTSENLRIALEEWDRFWLLDQPDHQSPFRTHGGII